MVYKVQSMELSYVTTTCPYCGTGCSLNLAVKDGKVAGTQPFNRSPINEGKLCPKGNFAHEFVNHEERLTKPLIKKDGVFVEVSWDEAIKLVVEKLKSFKPSEIACFASARVSNEDNYAMMKFARGALKTKHIDHCARLCHSSTVSGLASIFGSGAMTNSILDITQAKCIFILGSNTFEQHPLIGRKVVQAKLNGAKIIYADPRLTITGKQADLYMQFTSGSDVAILNCLMQQIITNGWEDKEFIKNRCTGYEELKAEVMKDIYLPENVEQISGIPADQLRQAAEMIATAESCTILYSMGITQHTCGVDNVKSVGNLQMLTGNLGKPGAGVNALRGQCNVQGACDMGCLTNIYTGYQNVTDETAHKKFADAWGFSDGIAPGEIGYAVTEIMNVLADNTGELKCLYIMGENPMIADPDITQVAHALDNLEFLVVQDVFLTETAEKAHVVLPAACFAERDGTQTNTERRVQRVRKAQEPVGEAKVDWKILAEIAAALGYEKQFAWETSEDVFKEIALLTPSYHGMTYERLNKPEALHWPCPDENSLGTPILHIDTFGMPDGKALMTGIEWRPPEEVPDEEYPFVLTTGRMLFHWHTGSTSRRSKRLHEEVPTGYVEVNDEDATRLGIKNGEMVRAFSRRGEIKIEAKVTKDIKKGTIFIPFHFAECCANVLTNNALDPISKIPEYKACAANIAKLEA